MTSSEGGGLHAYAALLRRPHVARFLLGGVIIQFPYAMVNMALLIGARDVYGSYSSAGVAAAVMSIAGAVFGPNVGRAIDKWGQKRVALRSDPGAMPSALSLTSVAEECMWVLSTPIATALATLVSPVATLVYGMRRWPGALWARFYIGLAALAVSCSGLVLVDSMPFAAVVMLIAGLFQAPTIVNINQIFMRIVPAARFTEGMALFGSMWVIGMSLSNIVAGAAIDRFGARGGFGTVVGFALAVSCSGRSRSPRFVGRCAVPRRSGGDGRRSRRIADDEPSRQLDRRTRRLSRRGGSTEGSYVSSRRMNREELVPERGPLSL